jgi:hypothetical protein
LRRVALLLLLLLLPPPAFAASGDIASGLTEALVVGAKRVVAELGRPGGFLDNPKFRIPLPGPLEQARSTLKMVGLSGLVDDLDVRLNRAAEQATPVAGDLLIQAIHHLTINDAVGILNGPKDSATRYLEHQTSQPLAEKMRPIIDRALADAGAVKAFDSLAGRYDQIPFVGNLKADLNGHVISYAERALFEQLGAEEARIRTDPAARTTDLLKRIFGH